MTLLLLLLACISDEDAAAFNKARTGSEEMIVEHTELNRRVIDTRFNVVCWHMINTENAVCATFDPETDALLVPLGGGR